LSVEEVGKTFRDKNFLVEKGVLMKDDASVVPSQSILVSQIAAYTIPIWVKLER
jgi:hypothetical protein